MIVLIDILILVSVICIFATYSPWIFLGITLFLFWLRRAVIKQNNARYRRAIAQDVEQQQASTDEQDAYEDEMKAKYGRMWEDYT